MNRRERLNRRVQRVLAALELSDVAALAKYKESELLAVFRCGRVTMGEIQRQLKERGLTFFKQDGYRPIPKEILRTYHRRGQHRDGQRGGA